LLLGDLKPGEWRYLTAYEIRRLSATANPEPTHKKYPPRKVA